MTALAHETKSQSRPGFSHRALLYGGQEAFVDGTLPFIRAGLQAGEPTLAVLSQDRIAILAWALNGDAGRVHFADMREVGGNPARIIPFWREFVDRHADCGGVRGIGEPVWPGRRAAELAECRRHEELLNVAFAGGPRFELLCPYDATTLDPAVIEGVGRSHPHICDGAQERDSDAYPGLAALRSPFDEPLPDPPADAQQLLVDATSLATLRAAIRRLALLAGIEGEAVERLVVGANELVCNSIRHGGGQGAVRLWHAGDCVVCEVRDSGRFDAPLAGRVRPDPVLPNGRGLWLANQLCDLVALRSGPGGTVARVYMWVGNAR